MTSHRWLRPSPTFVIALLALFAALVASAFAISAAAQGNQPADSASTSNFHSAGSVSIVRGFQSTSSPSGVTLMKVGSVGTVLVDCQGGMSRIAFYPAVSGSLWFIHGGAVGYVSGSSGTQLSNQATDDMITAQFATSTQTATMVISGHPAATCTYSGQATIQP
jgi:hypothetical protein